MRYWSVILILSQDLGREAKMYQKYMTLFVAVAVAFAAGCAEANDPPESCSRGAGRDQSSVGFARKEHEVLM